MSTQNFPQGPTPTFPVASPATGAIFNGTTLLVPQYAVINTGTTATVIAGTPGFIIRVISMDLVSSNAAVISWQSVQSTTQISGPQSFAQNGGIVRPFNQAGWFQTNVGEDLGIVISGGGTVGGDITYVTL